MDKQKLLDELKNAIFPSKEGTGIEHVDMSYEGFITKLELLAFAAPLDSQVKEGSPKGQATVVDTEPMVEQFPAHDENLTS